MIGTTIYHAIGYNVVDTYLVNVDPGRFASILKPRCEMRLVCGG